MVCRPDSIPSVIVRPGSKPDASTRVLSPDMNGEGRACYPDCDERIDEGPRLKAETPS